MDKVSPIDGDCGRLCKSACCDNDAASAKSPQSRFGMYLLPGEDKLFTRKEPWLTWSVEKAENYAYPGSWSGNVYFVQCKGASECDRAMRPIQCRSFPLAPYIDNEGLLRLILYPGKLAYDCPLISQRLPLNRNFITATYTVWKRLIRDPLIRDYVKMDSQRYGLSSDDLERFLVV